LDTLQNSWTNGFGTIQDFKELITYDRNGNILTYIRNGNKTFAGSPIGMDSLTYHYRPGTNKLSYVTDLVGGSNYGNDIDNQQVDNYKYDSIGNTISGMIDAEAAFKLQPNLIKMKAPNTELILKFGPYH